MTEGGEVEVSLTAQVFGFYAKPIAIAVVCSQTTATGVAPGMDPFQLCCQHDSRTYE